ncbi:hypothetical protein LTR91_021123 [Friedmanniomyces endolithicus]|uniref:Uncharacterized protein n=2 Tax=Dothideomycetidae TaxID=451867 RepID=A0AAN6HAT0_9PEZI|nr:hypothetical protein LTR91_021123 [Friedmanniomyces endolithicus]KAK1089039.1 hypothetical protein LTR48_000980 [Friedmanniomyces endolithicus]KAK5148524.1 hypothetical protein LTR32_000178 [Rachicladosporium monterosium]
MLLRKENCQRKRQRDQSASKEDESRLRAKRQKRSADDYPPDVWDNLSKITLTRKALREFDRRTREKRHPHTARVQETAGRILRSNPRRLERFARNGGPDLSKLRGYAALPSTEAAMNPSNSRTSKRQRDSGLAGSSFTGKTGTTGPYDPQFEQLLIDHGVYPDGYEDSDGDAPEPENIQAIRERLARSRSSLSPSHFDEVAFKQFQRTNRGASSEQNVMMNVFPTIRGNTGTKFYNEGNMLFKNLVQFAPSITDAKPDGYDGARPAEIDLAVRRTLNGYIIPSTSEHLPAAPNNLTEVKGPSGRSDVLRRQAMYAGGVGARGMFELQNYGNETPVYDGNAYTIVPTYHSGEGSLRVYATHPRQSAAGQTEYHMTQLRSYAMTDTSESFRQGAAALRNSRDLSREQRDHFIASANAAARRLPPVATFSSATASGSPVSFRTGGASFESNTSTEEFVPEGEEPYKRQRKRSAATSSVSGGVQSRGRELRQRRSPTGSSSTS